MAIKKMRASGKDAFFGAIQLFSGFAKKMACHCVCNMMQPVWKTNAIRNGFLRNQVNARQGFTVFSTYVI
jgi:hypothetical protein